jgi:hypothetical protein
MLNLFPFPWPFSFAPFAWTKSRAIRSANLLYTLATHQPILACSERIGCRLDSRAQSIMSGTPTTHTFIIRLRWTSLVKSSQVTASIHPSIHPCWTDRLVLLFKVCTPPPSRKHTLFVCLFVCLFPYQHFIFVEKGACASRKEGSTLFFCIFFSVSHFIFVYKGLTCLEEAQILFVCLFVSVSHLIIVV